MKIKNIALVLGCSLTSAVLLAATATGAEAQTRARSSDAIVLKVRANETLEGPKTARPGRTTFSITHAKHVAVSNVLLFKPRHKQSRYRLVHDLKQFVSTGTPTDLQADFANLGGIVGNHTFSIRLSKGVLFAVVATNKPKATKIHKVLVSGKTHYTSYGNGKTQISARAKNTWAPTPTRIPHKGTLTFVNKSGSVHDLYLFRLRSGKSIADAQAELKKSKPNLGRVFVLSRSLGIAALAPHRSERAAYHLASGKYALLDFWPGADSTSHASDGMIRHVVLR